jgi:hypothetical protein
MKKKFVTNQSRLDDLKRRGDLIKESFQKEFNKIKRLNESKESIDEKNIGSHPSNDYYPQASSGEKHAYKIVDDQIKQLKYQLSHKGLESQSTLLGKLVINKMGEYYWHIGGSYYPKDDYKIVGDGESTEHIEDGINPITGYDVDKVSPGLPKQKPYSTPHNPTTYNSTQIEKSRNDIRNDRDAYETKDYQKLKQLKESFDKTYDKIKRLNESDGTHEYASKLIKQIGLIIQKGEKTKPHVLCHAKKLGGISFEWCGARVKSKSTSFTKEVKVEGIDHEDCGYLWVNDVGYILHVEWEGFPHITRHGYYDPGKRSGHPDSWYPEEGEPSEWGFDDIKLSKAELEPDTANGVMVDVTEIFKAVGLDTWMIKECMEQNTQFNEELIEYESENPDEPDFDEPDYY